MDDHIIKQDGLGGYPHKDYNDNIHSIIESISNVIYLNEENGWIDSNGETLAIGAWDKDSRIATLDSNMEQRGKLFIIAVNNATIDGLGAIIGENEVGIYIIGQYNIDLKNFIIENTSVGIYTEFSEGITIEYMALKENQQSISVNRCNEVRIKNNLISSAKDSATGTFILDSGKVIIQNNSININLSNAIGNKVQYSYSGVISENSTAIYIVNNEIQIVNTNCEISGLEEYSANGYCINLYSTHDTLIKENNLYIKNNNFNLSNCNSAELNFSLLYLDSDNVKIEIEENNIIIEENKFDIFSDRGGAGVYGILESLKNDSNSIKNNLISIKNNIYTLTSNLQNNKYICFIAILLDSYNSYNEVSENQIEIKENVMSFEPEGNKAVNLICGIYLNIENATNNIINNNIVITENSIPEIESIITTFSLVYLYYNNICNTIKGNNLNDSEGNGITLISKNDVTEILENNINNNKLYGILLSRLKDEITTNTSLIKGNTIINNKEYDIYIVSGNCYNHIKNNNFFSEINKGIYDENSLGTSNYYDENYYNYYNE